MQNPSNFHAALAASVSTLKRPAHRRLSIVDPQSDCNRIEISAWASEPGRSDASSFAGRATLTIGIGPVRLSLSPTIAELRGMALLLTATADDQEMRNAGWMPGQETDDLAHAVNQMVRGVGQ